MEQRSEEPEVRRELTQARVRALLDYDPQTGVLAWRNRPRSDFRNAQAFAAWNTRFAGKPTGCPTDTGYLKVSIDKRLYRAHRLIFLREHGYLPEAVDHINGSPADNRLANLRAANKVINGKNTKLRSDNSSGRVGVCFDPAWGKWRAHIQARGRHLNLGRFRTFDAACAARAKAESKYGYHPNHGRAS